MLFVADSRAYGCRGSLSCSPLYTLNFNKTQHASEVASYRSNALRVAHKSTAQPSRTNYPHNIFIFAYAHTFKHCTFSYNVRLCGKAMNKVQILVRPSVVCDWRAFTMFFESNTVPPTRWHEEKNHNSRLFSPDFATVSQCTPAHSTF